MCARAELHADQRRHDLWCGRPWRRRDHHPRELLRGAADPRIDDEARQVQHHRGPHARVRRAHAGQRAGLVHGEQSDAQPGRRRSDRSGVEPPAKDLDSPGGARNGDGSDGNPAGAKFQLGGTIFYTDRPSPEQGCYTGNSGEQDNGAHTYWTGADEGEDRALDQATLDKLTLNCVPEPMAAAFCVWDGGRLQTYEENSAAFGAGPYPWGATPTVGGFGGDDFHSLGPAQFGATIGPCTATEYACRHDMMNWSSDYQFPEGGNAAKQWDYAYFISAPGRFPKDVGPGGHMDIGGLMMELTASGINQPGGDVPNDPE